MSASAIFDQNFYLTNNADVVVAISQGHFGSALQHYNAFGGKELRAPNSTFDPSYYAINNPDVLNAVAAGGFANVFAHYQDFGESENRAPTSAFASFDAAGYLAANADVAAAVTAGTFSSALDHFIAFGQNESREGSGVAAGAGSTAGTGQTFTLTSGTDIAGATASSQSGVSTTSEFKFTSANETIEALTASMQAADTLLDSEGTADNDVINITASGAMNALTAVNIETANVTFTAGTPTAVFTNFTGLDTVNVGGTVAGTVTDAGSANTTVSDITRVVTIDDSTGFGGTTAAANAETVNITVSGLSFGSTAATRSGITLTAANTGANETLETFNITSSGTAANDFVLDASDADVVLSTVNLLGSTDLVMRGTHADLTGVSLVGSSHTGATEVIIDRNGVTPATNVLNFAGIDTISVKDGTSPAAGGDPGSLTGVASGQAIKFLDDLGATVITGAAVSGSSDTLSITLDNETAATDTDMTSIDIQNIETVTINSSGFDTATGTTAQNLIDDLTGDMTTITVTGDTSLNLDLNIDAVAAGSTRTVTVDASANTKFVDIAGAAQATVAYNITGTAGADTLVLNNTNGTLTGGAGNDTLTSGTGNDTIAGGDGNDHIDLSTGTDTVSGGAGNDTYDMASKGTAATAQVSTVTPTGFDSQLLSVTINGTHTYTTVFNTDIATSIDDFIASHAANILSNNGVTATDGTTAINLGGAADGTAFTFSSTVGDGGVTKAGVNATTTAAVAEVLQVANISDFAAGDIIDVADILTEAGIVYHEGLAADGAAADNVYVLTDTGGFADAEAAEDAIAAGTISTDTADGLIVFLNSTLGHAQVVYDADISADAANLGGTSGDHVLVNLTGITTASDLAAAFSEAQFLLA